MARGFLRSSLKLLPLAVCACACRGTPASPHTSTPSALEVSPPPDASAAVPGSRQEPAVPGTRQEPVPGTRKSAPDTAPRLYAFQRVAWVYDKPHRKSRKLGYIGPGMSVALREASTHAPIDGCPRGFYAVEPYGYVCGDFKVTTNPAHPVVAAMRRHTTHVEGAYPFHYGLSLGAPMYNRLPDSDTHRTVMMRYPKPRDLGDWARFFEDLVDPSLDFPPSPVPEFLRDNGSSPNASTGFVRKSLPHGSMLAFTEVFEHDGRRWLLADDLSVVPADRVRAYRKTTFQGVPIDQHLWPPFGWVCGGEHLQFERRNGRFVRTERRWPNHSLIRLSEQRERAGKHSYRLLRDGKTWIRADHVCEVKVAQSLPEGVTPSGRWLYLSTLEGTLVAYDQLRPVYATLHASGRGGVHRGKGDVRNYTTPVGGFHINWKERYATFSPDPGAPTTFWISNVMFVRFFEQPYALHGAYWHERFGIPTSAGCPNLSPYDAQWLFSFTEPHLPDGWQGVAPARGDRGTLVVIGT